MTVLREPAPGESGTYALLFAARSGRIHAGRLGVHALESGWYLYLGSAFGPGGVAGRVGRHLAPRRMRVHWHVDRLHEVAEVREVWFTHDARPREHLWAREARRLAGASTPIDGFGSSDCRCRSHLIHLQSRPSAYDLESRLIRRAPTHARLYRWPFAPHLGGPEGR